MNTPRETPIVIDREAAEVTLERVAICAFTYYPDKPADEPGYTVDEDVTWCTATLRALPADQLAELRDTVRTLITDPSAERRTFIATLAALPSPK